MSVAAVVIGRNEGERLVRCLEALTKVVDHVIYVDSGSSDGSLEVAEKIGARTVSLDMDTPFTAARARNAGLMILAANPPEYVQLIDGDCEIDPHWVETAQTYMRDYPHIAAVAGRLREKHPEKNLWHRLADREWDTPIGETDAIGGIALARYDALKEVGGYRDSLIAGEEPEMCVRLREKGWKIWRLDAEMAQHDIAMSNASQWLRRCRRAGFAFAEVATLHRGSPFSIWQKEQRSILVWGALIPVLILFGTFLLSPYTFLLTLLYPLQALRLRARGIEFYEVLALIVAKFPQAVGVCKFWVKHLLG